MKQICTILYASFGLTVFAIAGCNHEYTAEGKVQKTEQGRDKYMLFLKSGSTVHRIIVSRPNMGADFKNVNLGDNIKVTSKDTVHWQDEVHMRATSIEVLSD